MNNFLELETKRKQRNEKLLVAVLAAGAITLMIYMAYKASKVSEEQVNGMLKLMNGVLPKMSKSEMDEIISQANKLDTGGTFVREENEIVFLKPLPAEL